MEYSSESHKHCFLSSVIRYIGEILSVCCVWEEGKTRGTLALSYNTVQVHFNAKKNGTKKRHR